MSKTPRCKWLSDTDFDDVCTNDECPLCADYCPVADTPDVCKWEDRGDGE